MEWREHFSNMALKSLVDVESLGYEIHPSVSYHGPSLSKRVEWYALYKGRRICENTTKPRAKRAAAQHGMNPTSADSA